MRQTTAAFILTLFLPVCSVRAICDLQPQKVQELRVLRCENTRSYVDAGAATLTEEERQQRGSSRPFGTWGRSQEQSGRILVAVVTKELTFEHRAGKEPGPRIVAEVTAPWHSVRQHRRYWWEERWGLRGCDDLPRDEQLMVFVSAPWLRCQTAVRGLRCRPR